MVAKRVDVLTRRAGEQRSLALVVRRAGLLHDRAGRRTTRRCAARAVVLHLNEGARSYAEGRTRSSASCASTAAHVPVPDRPRREAQGGRSRQSPAASATAPRIWAKPKSEITPGGLHGLLPAVERAVRRSGADDPLARRRAARIFRARLRAGHPAVRLFDPAPQGAHQALCPAHVHRRRHRDCCPAICASCPASSTAPTCRSTCRARRSRKAPSSARSGRAVTNRVISELEKLAGQGARALRQDLGGLRPGDQGRALRGLSSAAMRSTRSPASPPRRTARRRAVA